MCEPADQGTFAVQKIACSLDAFVAVAVDAAGNEKIPVAFYGSSH